MSAGPESETELLARCRRGDPDAWDELFDRHYAVALRFIFKAGPDLKPEDAEEICQEVFLSVIRGLDSFGGASQFQTWLFRIAANKTRDYRERQNAAKRGGGQTVLSLQAEQVETGLTLDPPDTEPAPDTVLMHHERAALVAKAVEQLPQAFREVVQLRYFGDLSYDEISRLLNLNVKTVSSRLSKCLDQLELIARRVFSEGEKVIFPSNS